MGIKDTLAVLGDGVFFFPGLRLANHNYWAVSSKILGYYGREEGREGAGKR